MISLGRTRSLKPFTQRGMSPARRGAAMVEFALVVPILFTFIFGIIEFARLNMLRNSIENAAYEGARSAIVPGGTASNATAQALVVLNLIDVKSANVVVTPATIDSSTATVTVSVSVPLSSAGWLFCFSNKNSSMTRTITLKREPS